MRPAGRAIEPVIEPMQGPARTAKHTFPLFPTRVPCVRRPTAAAAVFPIIATLTFQREEN